MPNSNGFNGLLMTVVGGLMILGIGASVVVYANDARQDEKLTKIERQQEKHEEQIQELHDSSIRVEGRLNSVDKSLALIAASVDKIAKKVE